MKLHIVGLIVLSLVTVSFAEEKATLTDVHDCCKKCAAGIDKAVATVPGVKAEIKKTTVVLTADNKADLQKAADAIVAAGYFGTSDNSDVKLTAGTAPDEKVTSLTVSGTHLCCAKCVKVVNAALKTVPGVTGDTAAKGADSFTVEGDFNAKDVMEALAKAGFTGTATK